jgi:hypothetical protein
MTTSRMLGLAAAIALLGCARSDGGDPARPIPNWPSTFQLASVKRVEIVYMPEEVATRANVSRAQLDSWYVCKVTIKEPQRLSWMNDLATSIHDLHPKPSKDLADLRWGVTFYGGSDRRIGSVYFDRFASLADLDGHAAEISGKSLRATLRAHFPTCIAK